MKKLLYDADQLITICESYRVRQLSVFGSTLAEETNNPNDLDLLIEFEEGNTPGILFFNLQDELSKIFGRQVDLNTSRFLSRHFRDQVVKNAKVIYAS